MLQATTHDAELIEIIRSIQAWHGKSVATLEQIAACKSESLSLQCDGENIELTGEKLSGFIAGIQVALMLISPLPLKVESHDLLEISPDDEEVE